jgi:hypothetical protein
VSALPGRNSAAALVASGVLALLLLLLACSEAYGAGAGSRLWARRYVLPGAGLHSPPLSAIGPDGSIYACGTYLAASAPSLKTVPYVVKYGRGGSRRWLWEQSFFNYSMAQLTDIGVDRHGNVYTCGTVMFDETDFDVLLLKHSPAGKLLWARIWGGAGTREAASAMAVSSGGAIWLAGGGEDAAGADTDYLLMRWTSAGSLVWAETEEASFGNDDVATGVALDGVGGVVFTGVTRNNDGDWDCVTMRRTTATVGWRWFPTLRYAGAAGGDEDAPRLARGRNGTVYVALESYAGPSRGTDIVLLACDRNNHRRWARRYDGPDHLDEELRGIAVDRDGNAYIAGISERAKPPVESAVALRYSRGGARKWAKVYRRVKAGRGAIYAAVTLDRSRRPYFAGLLLDGGHGSDALLAAYTAAGKLRWRRTYDGPAHLDDGLSSLGTYGNALYGSGATQGSSSGHNGLVLKYRQ